MYQYLLLETLSFLVKTFKHSLSFVHVNNSKSLDFFIIFFCRLLVHAYAELQKKKRFEPLVSVKAVWEEKNPVVIKTGVVLQKGTVL